MNINLLFIFILIIIFILLFAKVIEVKIKRLLKIFKIGLYFEIRSEEGLLCLIFGILFYILIKSCITTNWINFIPNEALVLTPGLTYYIVVKIEYESPNIRGWCHSNNINSYPQGEMYEWDDYLGWHIPRYYPGDFCFVLYEEADNKEKQKLKNIPLYTFISEYLENHPRFITFLSNLLTSIV